MLKGGPEKEPKKLIVFRILFFEKCQSLAPAGNMLRLASPSSCAGKLILPLYDEPQAPSRSSLLSSLLVLRRFHHFRTILSLILSLSPLSRTSNFLVCVFVAIALAGRCCSAVVVLANDSRCRNDLDCAASA